MPSTLRINNKLFVRSPRPTHLVTRAIAKSSGPTTDARTTSAYSAPSSAVHFELSPVPPNPLGEGRWIKTAAALVIGCVVFLEGVRSFHGNNSLKDSLVLLSLGQRDEILNGKTLDRNSHYFARYCFENGIELYVDGLCARLFVFLEERLERAPCIFRRERVEVIPDEESEMYVPKSCAFPATPHSPPVSTWRLLH
jgi:hypothetical protein